MTHLQPHATLKKVESDTYNAFDKAFSESNKLEDKMKNKHKILEEKREKIEGFVHERNKMIKGRLDIEKKDLEEVLIRIIKDALKFSKECTPMISMMPNKLSNVINQLKEERGHGQAHNLNVSTGSLNLSFRSNLSTRSVKKYESNAFLKALGLDLENLNPKNIKIDIEKAYAFIKQWKVKSEDISKVIRFKVVNEIMNVEERRSAQKIHKINTRINKYLGRKKSVLKKKDESFHSISTIDKQNLSLNILNKSNSRPNIGKNINTSYSNSKSPNKKKSSKSACKTRGKNKENSEAPLKKKKIILNAYKNVDKLVGYINESEKLRENKPLVKHFDNIQYNKYLDNVTRKLINKNQISAVNFSG
jgi:hypothetical protein